MLFKTHLVIGFFVALFFLPNVVHKFLFIPMVLIATILPDIYSAFSKAGNNYVGRAVQIFTKHRGLLHSFTFCFALTLLLVFYLPTFALPLFLGYATHLLLDSVTKEGIRPFWPLKKTSQGKLPVGGAVEEAIFMSFVVIDLIFLLSFFI
ncbi:MAG: metal-dependent hydrolase [Nanoarchaeota archaeon]